MTALFLAALFASLGVRLWLSWRQGRSVRTHRGTVPAAFAESIPLEAHQKAADYTLARLRLGRVAAPARAALLVAFTLGGGLAALARFWDQGTLLAGVAFVLSALFLAELCLLPFAIYRTFVLEERFGFNRTTVALFLSDLLKQALLSVLLGGPLVFGALWLIGNGGALWWAWLWAGWIGVSLFFAWAYPVLIAPFFFKFTPLGDAELLQRIQDLLQRTGFSSSGIFVMDGSRRSSHANAYFTGLGRRKRIVLYDNLCGMLLPLEIESVLAHELGHFKLKHLWWRLAAGAAMGFLGIAVFRLVVDRSWFYTGLGVEHVAVHAGLVLFLWVAPLFTFPLRPLLSAWSRRHEYAADAFAAAHSDGRALISALVKMYEHNAATLTPDPIHSAFHDSHPPAPLRVARLSEVRSPT
ncbi:MAG: M48 family metallopeptidase [Planctomycetota bacterium]